MITQSDLTEHDLNNTAFWREKDQLASRYPVGRFVGYSGGKIVADAGTFEELHAELLRQGKDPAQVLVAQAGAEYLKEAVIFQSMETTHVAG